MTDDPPRPLSDADLAELERLRLSFIASSGTREAINFAMGLAEMLPALLARARRADALEAEVQRLNGQLHEANAHIRAHAEETQVVREVFGQQLADAYNVLADLADDSPCRFDHHGYCQEHAWLYPGECPQARLKKLAAAPGGHGGEG